jgi:hypothetical protein
MRSASAMTVMQEERVGQTIVIRDWPPPGCWPMTLLVLLFLDQAKKSTEEYNLDAVKSKY